MLYYAEIKQATEEDWEDVEVQSSTAEASRGRCLFELCGRVVRFVVWPFGTLQMGLTSSKFIF